MSQDRESRSPPRGAASPQRRSPPRERSPSPRRARSPRREGGGGGGDRRENRRNGTSLLVRNLSYDAERRDLLQHFEKYNVVDAHVPLDYHTRQPRGFGFVEFERRDDAMDAMSRLDETELMGRTIRIIEARGNRKSADEMKTELGQGGGGYGGGYGGGRGGGGGGYGRDRDDRERRRSRSPRRRSPPREDRYDSRSGGHHSRDRRSRSR